MSQVPALPEHDYQSPLSEEWLFKAGATLFLVAGPLGGLGQALHPRPNPDDHLSMIAAAAATPFWIPIHVASMLSVVLTLAGLVALSRSLSTQPERGLARLGLMTAVIGAAVTLVGLALDGVALRHIADAWSITSGADRAVMTAIALAVEELILPLQALNTLAWFGAPFVAFGLSVIYSSGYPSRIGWIAVVAGTTCIVLGVVQLVSGFGNSSLLLLVTISTTINSLWMIPISILLRRRARALAVASLDERMELR